jgi:hypothetical protein
MKKALSLFVLTLALSSCHDYWPQEDKDVYYKTCYDDAMNWAGSEANAKTYCDCVLEKVTTKYKTVDELMEHALEIPNDPDIQQCKQTITIPQ